MSCQLSSSLWLAACTPLGDELSLLIVGEWPPLPLSQLVEEVHCRLLLPTRAFNHRILRQLACLLVFHSRLINKFSENLFCRIRDSRAGKIRLRLRPLTLNNIFCVLLGEKILFIHHWGSYRTCRPDSWFLRKNLIRGNHWSPLPESCRIVLQAFVWVHF